jgi:hypothetical protein
MPGGKLQLDDTPRKYRIPTAAKRIEDQTA